MEWLIFLVVIASDETYIGYDGNHVAITDTKDNCEMIGRALAKDLTNTSIINDMGVVFEYRCVYDAASV